MSSLFVYCSKNRRSDADWQLLKKQLKVRESLFLDWRQLVNIFFSSRAVNDAKR